MKGTKWSYDEVAFLRKNIHRMSPREIGLHLGRSRDSVKNKWANLNKDTQITVGKVSSEEKSFIQKLRKWLR